MISHQLDVQTAVYYVKPQAFIEEEQQRLKYQRYQFPEKQKSGNDESTCDEPAYSLDTVESSTNGRTGRNGQMEVAKKVGSRDYVDGFTKEQAFCGLWNDLFGYVERQKPAFDPIIRPPSKAGK